MEFRGTRHLFIPRNKGEDTRSNARALSHAMKFFQCHELCHGMLRLLACSLLTSLAKMKAPITFTLLFLRCSTNNSCTCRRCAARDPNIEPREKVDFGSREGMDGGRRGLVVAYDRYVGPAD